ncbi:DHH family phosphoesterase [Anaerobacillus sp. MEB173]|uniref:DHH family phosphoesterase n=1 Tax=Anaerobacillus sp. MEB173 TaxID=3383345 RepID=UPI003F92CD55
MPKFLLKRWHGYHVIALFVLATLSIAVLTYYQWIIGLLGFFLLGLLLIYALQAKASFIHDLEDYIATLSHRIHKSGEDTFLKLPFGVVLYNENSAIEWVNPYMTSFINNDLLGHPLEKISKELTTALESKEKKRIITINDHKYLLSFQREEGIVYFFDVTDQEKIKRLYEEEQQVIGFIYLDNYDEVTQGMDDQILSKLVSQVTSSLNRWAQKHDILLRRTSSDRFIAIFNQRTLELVEETKFDILDEIRESTGKEKIPLTLSIGIGSGESSLRELGALAQSSLDLALGRGGDQVAIKHKTGKVRFYGGKSNAVEKRTRVRARVISHALRDFVNESDRVVIMGHKNPDMDAIGAAIGIFKVAEANGKEGYIILDKNELNSGVQKLMDEVEKHDRLWAHFITPEEALEEMTDRTLLVVVDTHIPSLVIEPRLLKKVERVVVIDHHRRGEEFITDPVLVYMEPYASSTAELVTELLEYQPNRIKMDILESTALLAGIIVDTKSFALRTGARTFDAASYLRSQGADTTLVQKLLKEDIEQYVKRSKLIESATIYKGGIAIAKGHPDKCYDQVLIAQAADTLLTMNDVIASFVISKRKDGKIGISARSLGEVNVQVIMEALQGGGHLTHAATQIKGISIVEAEDMLKEIIDDYLKGGEE